MPADMIIGVENSRFFCLTAASMFGNRKVCAHRHSDEQTVRATGAKIYATDTALKVCNLVMEMTGRTVHAGLPY